MIYATVTCVLYDDLGMRRDILMFNDDVIVCGWVVESKPYGWGMESRTFDTCRPVEEIGRP